MLFCQVWIARMAATSNLAKHQTNPLENPCGSNSGLRYSLEFLMSLYKEYLKFRLMPIIGSLSSNGIWLKLKSKLVLWLI